MAASTSSEQKELKRSKSMHIYPTHTYYNIEDEISQRNTRYGSFSGNNHKHYKKKLKSKSSSDLYQNYDDIPFSQYTPDPYYSIMSNEYVSSTHLHIDPDDLYFNTKDNDSNDNESNDNGVEITDSSSNVSSFETTHSVSKTSTDILNQIIVDNRESSHHPLLGMLLVTISAVCYAALNLSVKALMYETPWQELMFIRMTITWIATMAWVLIQYKGKLSLCGPKHQRCLLILRAFFLWGAMFTCWWSFEFLPVGDGTTLAMSFPVWVSVFAHFVWRNDNRESYNSSQRLDLFGWICVLAGLLGITFVAQPTFIFGTTNDNYSSHRDIGIIIGIISAICAGAQYVIVNYTKKDCHWLQVEQMTAALSTFVLCPLGAVAFAFYYYLYNGHRFIIGWSTLSPGRWAEEIALGLLGFCALALLTRGSQLDAPARTAICLYLEIPFVYIGQCIMTDSIPGVYIFIGIFLVLCSVIIPAVRKLRRSNQERLLNEKLRYRKYSGDSGYGLDETLPLIRDNLMVNIGAMNGVTVDWSSEESNGNTDIDDDDVVTL